MQMFFLIEASSTTCVCSWAKPMQKWPLSSMQIYNVLLTQWKGKATLHMSGNLKN